MSSSAAPLIDGTYNSRDTGGTPLRSGGETRSGVLYRSDALSSLTDAGRDDLAATGVGTIVDFRTEAERGDAPNLLPESPALRTVTLSILEGAMSMPAGAGAALADPAALRALLERIPTLDRLYVGMLESGAASFAEVARIVARSADERSGVLIHCTAGKDRTGVATALLLDAVGAERDAVVADYAVSASNLAGPWAERMLARTESWGVPRVPQIEALVTATPPAAIEAALAWTDERGGAAAYLRAGGLEDADLALLRERLAG